MVGERYWQELQKVEDRYTELKQRVLLDRSNKKESKGSDELEQVALDSMHAEVVKEYAKAARRWEDLKRMARASSERRPWYLLAAKGYYEMRKKE